MRDISPYGIVDMGGNVSEWVNDFYSATVPHSTEIKNPVRPLSGTLRTVKGGSAVSNSPESSWFVFNRLGVDPLPPQPYGFRCVISDVAVSDTLARGSETPVKISAMNAESEAPVPNCVNRIGFVDDISIPDGTIVTPGSILTKTWKLKNIGTCPITSDYKVIWSDTVLDNPQKLFDFGAAIQPNEEKEISIKFPVVGNGKTRILFEFATPYGEAFKIGERGRSDLWVDYVVQ